MGFGVSQVYPATNDLTAENDKPLYYSVWLITDQKWSAVFLFVTALFVGVIVWQYGGNLLLEFIALLFLLATVWRILMPVHFELNSGGIVYRSFNWNRFIAWGDIRRYQIRRNGILLLPRADRFFLEAFRGFYLPVPKPLMPEVLYRLRVFVDRISD
ncbi:MAG: hypothetical protein LBU34_15220 [Planctomycetaceae bacterium]|jgi:hypothetical protein|nr:hypothetical protein [Planctomycetaceae bacterium]